MKKQLLFFALLILHISGLRAQLLLGLHASGNKLIYAYQKKISVMSLRADTIELSKELVNDTGITMPVYRKAVALHRLSKPPDLDLLKNAVLDFSMVNLTFHANGIFVGIRYHLGKTGVSKLCYGIILLDSALNMRNFYLFRLNGQQAFSLPPYFPMEFTGRNHLMLPDIDSGKVVFAKFYLSDTLHEVRRTTVLRKNVQIAPYLQIKSPENLILDPVLFSVQGSAYRYYFQFPNPVVFKQNALKIFDPTGVGNSMKSYRNPSLGDGTHLLFERQIRRDSSVVLATCTDQDSFFMLSSSTLPGFVELDRCEAEIGVYSPRWIRTETLNRYYLLNKRRLIVFHLKNGKPSIVIKPF